MAWAAPQELIAQDDAVVVLGHGVSTRRRLYLESTPYFAPWVAIRTKGAGRSRTGAVRITFRLWAGRRNSAMVPLSDPIQTYTPMGRDPLHEGGRRCSVRDCEDASFGAPHWLA
jgi:hypothetical protein